uniref:Vascular endothelial growth factor A-like n=1 Tax=Callorhinchus milii TaxID=7868 RepID=A0A4W3GV96_CALMI
CCLSASQPDSHVCLDRGRETDSLSLSLSHTPTHYTHTHPLCGHGFCWRPEILRHGPAARVPALGPRLSVILFEEVWNRSYCRTIEVLVDVIKEYPSESAYIFKPSCVPLFRCAGCCGDEKLQCTAQETHNITMQIIKLKPSEHVTQQEEKTFTEHSSCECRPRRKRLKGERRNSKRRGQKRNSSKLARETAPSRSEPQQLKRLLHPDLQPTVPESQLPT